MTPLKHSFDSFDTIGLSELVRKKKIQPKELLDFSEAKINRFNPDLNAVVLKTLDKAREQLRSGKIPKGPFYGVPLLIKDLLHEVEGQRITSGSKALLNYIAPKDSEFVSRLRKAGFLFIGTTNVPEFALMGITEPKAHGATRNPWDPERTPGGSSGGSAAAVASGMSTIATGSDGGGSIRIPAAYCGLFGLKPSRGIVPVHPLGRVWQGASVDHVLTKTVRDSAAVLDLVAGTSVSEAFHLEKHKGSYLSEIKKSPGKLKIAYSFTSPIGTPVNQDHIDALHDTVKLLKSLGHKLEEASPNIDGKRLAKAYVTMYFGEVAADIAKFDKILGRKAKMSDVESTSWILGLLGKSVSAGEFVSTIRFWDEAAYISEDFLGSYDLYLTPTTAEPPAKIGELAPKLYEEIAMQIIGRLGTGKLLLATGMVDQLVEKNLARTPFTQLANLTGQPSMSVPLSRTKLGLPIGMLFTAKRAREDILFRLAGQLEKEKPWADIAKA
ncbi:amidase [Leptospira semungkisensis]|uniref:Amidase n=1 Tax=Leptospira semungkisensis TaxID=2484985 RepID=A0A4R9G9F2_9LEPT|nr:amidase family protein [Leptospira semungkisensis]TGK07905.1 amidase [Leptospira semungkisensis]